MQIAASVGTIIGTSILTALVSHKVTASVHGEQIITLFKKSESHDAFKQKVQDRFDNLHNEFVPRTELTQRFEAVQKSQERTETKLDFLIFNKKSESTNG